jgi:hypothetical protein
MALVLKDRVKETGTANTTVSFTLAGAVAGFQSFSAVGNTNTTYYAATDGSNNWEAGLGTYSTTGPTLTRTTILSSSNSGSAVTFSGTVTVFLTYPSSKSVYLDSTGTNINITLPPASGGTGITSLGTGVATWLGTPSAANLAAAVTDETGSGNLVFATSPTLVTPVLGTPTSGTLSGCTVEGTNSVGFRNIPINSQSAAYTTVLADSGKVIFHPSTDANARTFTIDSNANVAYALGTAITFINMTSQVVTIAITSDTMYLAGAGTTGSRSLAQYGMATAVKMTSTTWIISGNGLT